MNEPRVNIPEWTVSELAAALKKTVEDSYGFVRVRGEVTGYRGPHSSGHVYFALKDENAKIDAVIWRTAFARIRHKPEEGLEVIATGRLTTYPNRSSYQIIIESLEPAGVGALMALLEERKKKLAAEGLFDEATQAAAALSADRDRRHHVADRRGDPRHPASAVGSLSAPRSALAGARAGRGLGRGGRGRDPRLQCAFRNRADRAPRPDDRGARRRLARGPVVIQRGDRGARRGRQHDPADLGGRPRDRHHADRFRRPTGAPRRRPRRPRWRCRCASTCWRRSTAWRGGNCPAGHAGSMRAAPSCALPRARCRAPTNCWHCRARNSMRSPSGCRAR